LGRHAEPEFVSVSGGRRTDRRRLPLAISSITDVAERQLCTGCGVCAFVQPGEIVMVDDPDAGRRPLVEPGVDTSAALHACPGVGLEHGEPPVDSIASLRTAWGPVLEVWEGHASDDAIRFSGSSGGVATALAVSAIEGEGHHGALHIRAREDAPILNETVLSTDRAGLLAGSGSRYAPASPCDGLHQIREAPGPCVFIGKPCDVAATARARRSDRLLDEKLGLTVAIFCAGTPTLRGTLAMLEAMGVDDPASVTSLRYRGNGWPGDAHVRQDSSPDQPLEQKMSYEESWGDILQQHRQWRCYVCVDHTGEFADIAVGDPWYRDPETDELGSNLILVRSERGRRALSVAMRHGHVVAHRVGPEYVPASQPGLRRVRGAVWGRIATSRLFGIPAPRYRRMPTFRAWLFDLTVRERLQSTVGLVRRIPRRGLWRRHPVKPLE
jgi:coenzyme F420 hydrogenase subunit beta